MSELGMSVTVVTSLGRGQIGRRDDVHIHRRQPFETYDSHVSSNETLIPIWPPPKAQGSRTPWIAAAVVGLLIAAVMAFLWLGARGESADRALERDTAIAERDAVNETKIANDAELETLRNDMTAAQEALADAQATATNAPSPEEVAEAEAAIAELGTEIERLTQENEALQEEAEAAAAATTTTTTTVAAEAAAPEETASTTVPAPEAIEPADPDEVGDQLSSLYRNSVLGDGQKRCLGDFVLGNLGNAETVTILDADDASENDALETSVREAAAFCGISTSAVFG